MISTCIADDFEKLSAHARYGCPTTFEKIPKAVKSSTKSPDNNLRETFAKLSLLVVLSLEYPMFFSVGRLSVFSAQLHRPFRGIKFA